MISKIKDGYNIPIDYMPKKFHDDDDLAKLISKKEYAHIAIKKMSNRIQKKYKKIIN